MSEQTNPEWYLERWKERMGTLKDEMTMWEIIETNFTGEAFRHISGLIAVVDFTQKDDGKVWQHVSASYRHRVPSYEEMTRLRNLFIGDRYAYMVFPPAEFYVNLHPYCLHLWSRCDGPALPEFSKIVPGIKGRSI